MYLNCHSFYSLKYGTLSLDDLVKQAVKRGIECLALTDINLTSGVFDFVKACKEAEIKPVIGVEFRNGDEFKYICLARNTSGFAEINAFLSRHLLDEKPFPLQPPQFEDVFVIYSPEILDTAVELKAYEYIGIKHWEQSNVFYQYRNRLDLNKCVAWQPVTFLQKNPGYHLHRLLRAIDHNVLITKLPAEAHATAYEEFPEPDLIDENFKTYPDIVKNAVKLLDACTFEFDTESPKNKKVFSSSVEEDRKMLQELAIKGMKKRYGENNEAARERIERELYVIQETNFEPYFLIAWDIIEFAKSRGFHHVGRGSGANSVVAYCIGITDVDPIKLDLYFERFINLSRKSPPDFDIDFSWDERDVIYNYIFDKYGADHVCLMATCSAFRGRSIYRELGKVFGLPKSEIDELVNNPGGVHRNEHVKYIFRFAELMTDFPEKLSIHAGGVLISDRPLYHYTGLQPMAKGFPICQFDMYMAEEIGFAKFDILSQRGLGHIKSAVDIIRENRGVEIDIHTVDRFMEDKEVIRHLKEHETMGAFYVESPAMRQLMWKLDCDNYLTLVAASSIIRPGVSASGMMQQYIKCHHDKSAVRYADDVMKELLHETYGIMIYQEDVIKVAHHFAGFDLEEADMLRRAMSGKYRTRINFSTLIEKWYTKSKALGREDAVISEVWRQIESFSGFSFSKAHSASYAVESYQSLFLKAHYPLEFMVAVINNFGGFYYAEMYIHEARRYGAVIEAPEVNQSRHLTRIEGITIWLGWTHVEGLERRVISKIEHCRDERPFYDFEDFADRVDPGLEQLIILVRIGAFRGINECKKELLWRANMHYHRQSKAYKGVPSLFGSNSGKRQALALPAFTTDDLEEEYDQMEYLGFPLSSAFRMIAERPLSKTSVADLAGLHGKIVEIYGYMVITKSIRTKSNKHMAFGYFIDHKGEYFDTTHFPQTIEKYPFKGKGVYFMRGKVIVEYGFPSVEVSEMRKVELKPDPRTVTG
ncbi:DNA polymerase III subunit alpha [Emticicia sp. CRIBPO]|uniref:DNA polymerase III subunit alpha n=1 Tax=Emticicia sp. CRIBPO TaxID=2683258 RepID=UPI001411B5AE|nr:DNA polymerase III subunit alpha [Emticicia sp. CRIBPO]NBA88689.1 DNA polymerase III subunit alpha [Emticicia sp. CRIBPO]